jgi:hypothetical protein
LKTADEFARQRNTRTVGSENEAQLVFVDHSMFRMRRRIPIHDHAGKIHDGEPLTLGILGLLPCSERFELDRCWSITAWVIHRANSGLKSGAS